MMPAAGFSGRRVRWRVRWAGAALAGDERMTARVARSVSHSQLLSDPRETGHRALIVALSPPGEGARRAGEGDPVVYPGG